MSGNARGNERQSRWFNWFSASALGHVMIAFVASLGVVLLIPEISLPLPAHHFRSSVPDPSDIAEYLHRFAARVLIFVVGGCVGLAFARSGRFPFRGWLGCAVGLSIGVTLFPPSPDEQASRWVCLQLIGIFTLGELTGIGYSKFMSLQQSVAEHIPDRGYLRRLRR